jgi:hypothetical protein
MTPRHAVRRGLEERKPVRTAAGGVPAELEEAEAVAGEPGRESVLEGRGRGVRTRGGGAVDHQAAVVATR